MCSSFFVVDGHVAYMLSTFTMPSTCAVMATDFIVTKGKCAQLFYQWLYRGTLSVYLVGEDGEAELMKSVSMSSLTNYTSITPSLK
jgi:hypothetical protein